MSFSTSLDSSVYTKYYTLSCQHQTLIIFNVFNIGEIHFAYFNIVSWLDRIYNEFI